MIIPIKVWDSPSCVAEACILLTSNSDSIETMQTTMNNNTDAQNLEIVGFCTALLISSLDAKTVKSI